MWYWLQPDNLPNSRIVRLTVRKDKPPKKNADQNASFWEAKQVMFTGEPKKRVLCIWCFRKCIIQEAAYAEENHFWAVKTTVNLLSFALHSCWSLLIVFWLKTRITWFNSQSTSHLLIFILSNLLALCSPWSKLFAVYLQVHNVFEYLSRKARSVVNS